MGEEYNKIHAMAYARKLVMQKFGPDVIGTHFWPMADPCHKTW